MKAERGAFWMGGAVEAEAWGAGRGGQHHTKESESLCHLGSGMKFDWTDRLGKDRKSEEVPILSSRQ